MFESSLSHLAFLKPFLSQILIILTVFATYSYTLKCTFVSDDIAGITEYDGKLQGWEYGMLWRWVRYHICGGNAPSKHKIKTPDGKETIVPRGKVPARHHLLSIIVFTITCLVTYTMLVPIIGAKLSLLSVLILIVHPCTTQGVAWISGVAYPLSLFWISITVILMHWFYASPNMNHAMIAIPLFVIIQFFSIHAIFATTALVGFLLLFLGYWQFAILGLLVSGAMCFDQIRKTVQLRVSEFKKQHMGQSTVFGWRKFIVAMKTLWYYICFSIAPVRMGLYHEWGFHYDSDIELADHMFWMGLVSLATMGVVFFYTDSVAIKLGILWFVIFSTGFWNWITAQQFVTERYIMVANLGLGMIIATLTQNYLWIYTFILGCYLVRTWCHLPTYDNELRFYQSNHWNFQKSEVALGNLGVTYARLGMEGTAKEHWVIATGINPNYDVPWVNIFYHLRTNGTTLINNGDYVGGINKFKEALPFLERAIACKICHFPEQWRREHLELLQSIRNPSQLLHGELGRLLRLRESLRNMLLGNIIMDRVKEVESSIRDNDKQISNLVTFIKANNLMVQDQSFYNKFNTEKMVGTLTSLTRR